MTAAAFVLAMLCAAPAAAPDSVWSDSPPAEAQRMVTVEVVDGDRVTSVWTFPVKLWRSAELASRPAVTPVKRWFVATHLSGTKKNAMAYSQTSLSGVEADSALVSFEWYATDKGDEKPLIKHVLRVPLGETALWSAAPGIKLRAKYAPREN